MNEKLKNELKIKFKWIKLKWMKLEAIKIK